MKTLFLACLCTTLYLVVVSSSTPYHQPGWRKGARNVRKEPLSGRAQLPFDSIDAVVRRCVDEQARAYVAETVVTPARVCKAEKAFLHCFDAEGFPERVDAGLAVLRSVVMGQYVTTVLPFCGTVNHGDKLRDVNKNAAGDCTILDVQNCFARAVFSLPGAWTPCVVQPLAFGCYMRECLGPKVGPAPNIVSHVMAYHLNSTLTQPGLCDHMETSRISNDYDYLY